VDIKARDATGRVFAVEMQMLARADHRQRLLYYAARLYSQQLVEGEAYDQLPPAYLISFVNARVIPDSSAFHTRFVLRDAEHDLTFTDDFAVHMIELPKFLAAVEGFSATLAGWCFFLLNANQLDTEALPEPLTTPAIRKAMETLRVISEIERERELYESRRKRQLDDLSLAKHYAKRDAYYAQKEAEHAQKEAEHAKIEAEQRQKDQELRERQQALAEGYQRMADQFQALADQIDDLEAKAELLRQRDEQLALLKTLRGEP
jgi:predicted transposase/invertase (TIGR01784 family)